MMPAAIGEGRPKQVRTPPAINNDSVQVSANALGAFTKLMTSEKSRIDTIVKYDQSGERKIKVYCDKWIHDGVCAFTQQGCKYKHEMPMDRHTQHSLGLFNGLPAWYKKQMSPEFTSSPRGDSSSRIGTRSSQRGAVRAGQWRSRIASNSGESKLLVNTVGMLVVNSS
jgi:hypothetical protein